MGYSPVHYLHQSYPREEMAALYLAADVMLVTPLRDGMNLVAKEYVACPVRRGRRAGAERVHRRGRRAGRRLPGQPARHRGHEGHHRAGGDRHHPGRGQAPDARDARRVREHDVARWAASFLDSLRGAPGPVSSRRTGPTWPADSSGRGRTAVVRRPGRSSGSGRAGRSRPSCRCARRAAAGPSAERGAAVGGWAGGRGGRRGGGCVRPAARWSSRMCSSRSGRSAYRSPQSGQV